jgi:hypothetical protein
MADPTAEPPVDDWAEQQADLDDPEDSAEDGPTDDLEVDDADAAEQARVLADDDPYPHD